MSLVEKSSRLHWKNQFAAGDIQPLLALGAGLLSILLFALTPTTTRIAIAQIDGLGIGLIRPVGGGAMAIALIVVLRIQPPRGPGEWKMLGLFSIGSFALFPILFSVGTQITSATHASLIMASMPLVTATIGLVLDRKLPSGAWLLGAFLGLTGETGLVLAAVGASSAQPTIVGDLIVLASCIFFCLGAVAGSRLAACIGPWRPTLWAVALAGLVLLLPAMREWSRVSIIKIAPVTWVALLHLCIGVSVVACAAWCFALARGGIVRVAPLQFAQPVLAVCFAVGLVGESVDFSLLACGLMILIGLVITWRNAPVTGAGRRSLHSGRE
jgi:drug/metabolite transporter (DMT)-like permease